MSEPPFTIAYTPKALKDLKAIKDTLSQKIIKKSIEKLEVAPEEYGVPYKSTLADFYKMRTARNFRIIYSIQEDIRHVTIHVIDNRDGVYDVAYSRLVSPRKT